MNPHAQSLSASWIWRRQESYTPYHQVILARKTFRLAVSADRPAHGTLKIAVDGSYRLFVNGEWVADGPARSWPEHFQYDQLDVTPYLRSGLNELAVIARHWQTGDFHTCPRQAGLLVQLDLRLANGHLRRIASDQSWETAMLEAWSGATPKVSIQMEPQELYDARLAGEIDFTPAEVLYPARRRPLAGPAPARYGPAGAPAGLPAPLPGRQPGPAPDRPELLPAGGPPGLAARDGRSQPFPVGRRRHGDRARAGRAGRGAPGAGGHAGQHRRPDPARTGSYTLSAGRHLLLAFAWPIFGHRKERYLRIVEPPAGLRLINPQAGEAPDCRRREQPAGCLRKPLGLPGPAGVRSGGKRPDLDLVPGAGRPARCRSAERYRAAIDVLLSQFEADGRRGLLATAWLSQQIPDKTIAPRQLTAGEMFVSDTHWLFTQREVLGSAAPPSVDHPGRADAR